MSDTDTPADKVDPNVPDFEGDFDEDRAKKAIAKLRGEVDDYKTRLAAVTTERDDFKAAAEKTGTDRDEALSKALERAEKAERTLAIAKHNLPDDVVEEFADFLTGTPEEVDAKAARLAARLAPKEEQAGDEDKGDEGDEGDKPETPPATPPARPRPALTPGHGGEPSPEFDPAAIATAARR